VSDGGNCIARNVRCRGCWCSKNLRLAGSDKLEARAKILDQPSLALQACEALTCRSKRDELLVTFALDSSWPLTTEFIKISESSRKKELLEVFVLE
jgi:hypothetical protein